MPKPATVALRLSETRTGMKLSELELPLNPDSLEVELPARITTIQTLKGAYQDIFGAGIARGTIRGHTGHRLVTIKDDGPYPSKEAVPDAWEGREIYRALSNLYRRYLDLAKENPEGIRLQLLYQSEGYFFDISPETFRLTRSRTEPRLFRYEMPFVIVSDWLNPCPPDPVAPPAILNPAPAVKPAATEDKKAAAPKEPAAVPEEGATTTHEISEVKKEAEEVGPKEETTYEVQSGDTLWGIATTYYKDGSKWQRIWERNRDIIADPNLIYPGQQIVVPLEGDHGPQEL